MTALHQRLLSASMADAEPRRLLAEDRTPWGLAVSLIGALLALLCAVAAIGFLAVIAYAEVG